MYVRLLHCEYSYAGEFKQFEKMPLEIATVQVKLCRFLP